MNKIDQVDACRKNGFNCAQAILSTYGPQYGIDPETALKAACAFGQGMGAMGETCGAVTGAFMVISMKHGKYTTEDDQARVTTYQMVKEFTNKFRTKNGSIRCKDLLGYDIGTPEGMKIIMEKGITKNLCPDFIKDAATILEEMLK